MCIIIIIILCLLEVVILPLLEVGSLCLLEVMMRITGHCCCSKFMYTLNPLDSLYITYIAKLYQFWQNNSFKSKKLEIYALVQSLYIEYYMLKWSSTLLITTQSYIQQMFSTLNLLLLKVYLSYKSINGFNQWSGLACTEYSTHLGACRSEILADMVELQDRWQLGSVLEN